MNKLALSLAFASLVALAFQVCAQQPETLARLDLKEYLGHTWSDELISIQTGHIAPGKARAEALALVDEAGKAYPVQLSDVQRHDDGSVRSARVWTVVTLPARGALSLRLVSGKPLEVQKPAAAQAGDKEIVLDNGTGEIAVRLAASQNPEKPVPLAQMPAPFQSVRMANGAWAGKGWFVGATPIRSLHSEVTAQGPLFAEARLTYAGEGATHYTVTVRVIRGKPVAMVEEEFNLPAAQDGPETVDEKDPSDGGRIPVVNFSFSEGFKPDAARYKGYAGTDACNTIKAVTSTTEGAYDLKFDAARRTYSVMAFMSWWPDLGQYYNAYRKADGADGPVLGVMKMLAGRWFNPTGLQLWTDPQAGLYLSAPLGITHRRSWPVDGVHDAEMDTEIYSGVLDPTLPRDLGRRAWAFFTARKGDVVTEEWSVARALPNRLMISLGELPLEKVKDWTLAWDSAGERHPRLRNRPEDVPAAVARIKNMKPGDVGGGFNYADRYMAFLLSGTAADGQKLLHDAQMKDPQWIGVLNTAQSTVDDLLDGGGATGRSSHFFPLTINTRRVVTWADYALAVPDITPEQETNLKAMTAFLVYVLTDPDYNPVGSGFHLGNPNMPLSLESTVTMAGCLMPSHPSAGRWAGRGITKLSLLFERFADPVSGAWEECPHYMMDASFYQAFEAFIALRNSGYEDLFRLPGVKRALGYTFGIISPPDPRFGIRILGTQGNSSLEGCTLLGWAAAAYANSDPALSAECQWMWDADGRQVMYSGSFEIARPELPMTAPRLRSAWYRGFGAVLRNGFPDPNETWMAYRQGMKVSHYEDGDQGSWHLYAKGAPLSLDFGSQYAPMMVRPWLHNRISVDHKLDTMLKSEHDIDEFYTTAGCDFVSGRAVIDTLYPLSETPYEPMKWLPNTAPEGKETIPPTTWRRSIVFVKDKDVLGPNYFLVRDTFDGATRPTDWSCWCLADRLEFQGNVARFTGQHGVDLAVFALEPGKADWALNRGPVPPPPSVATLSYGPGVPGWPEEYQKPKELHPPVMSHTFSYLGEFWRKQNPGKNYAKEFEERQICARLGQPVGKGYLVLLYPYRRGQEEVPAVTAWAGGQGAALAFKEAKHFVLSTGGCVAVDTDGVEALAATAVARSDKQGVSLHLMRGERLSFGGLAIQGSGPATLSTLGGKVAGEIAGGGRTVTFTVPKQFIAGKKLVVDGKIVGPVKATFSVTVPAGEHTFALE